MPTARQGHLAAENTMTHVLTEVYASVTDISLCPVCLAGALVLPTGQLAVMNKNMMQVINPYSGEALAVAPSLPGQYKDLVWE